MKTQRTASWGLAFGSLLVAAIGLAGMAQTAQKAGTRNGLLLDNTFDATEGGWIAMGGSGEARLTPDAAHVKTGKPALAFDYKIEPGQINAAVLPVAAGSLARLKQLKFWLKTDATTSVAVVLSEKKPGGGNYGAVLWSPKNTWQQIDLIPNDFALNEGPTDPKDPDGKLDLDQVEGIGIIDLGQLFAALSSRPDFPVAVDSHSGPHTFYLDDFQALAEAPRGAITPPALASSAPSGSPPVVIEDFRRPFLNWLTLGGADLSLSAAGNPLGHPALQAQYQQTDGKFVVIVHPIGQLSLGGTARLAFDVASAQNAQMVVALEKKKSGSQQGPRYNTTLEVPGNSKPVHESISFADFTLDENGPADPEGKLSPEQIKSISLTDITAALTHEEQKNTIWIAQIRAEGSAGEKAGRPAQVVSPAAEPSAMGTMTMTHAGQSHDAEPAQDGQMVMNQDEHSHVTETMSHHMHMGAHMKMTELRPENAQDKKRAVEIVTALRSGIEKYKDYHVALKDGFIPYMPNLRLPEYHFTNYKYAFQEAFRFDPAYPTSLLYKKTPDGYSLLGAMYTAPDRLPEEALNSRVPLSVTRWHLHINICEPPGGMTEKANWMKFGPAGSISTEAACTAAGGTFKPHLFGWMVHVYPFETHAANIWPH